MKDLLTTLQNSRNYTLLVAQAMPENSYDFKPTEAVWSFGELLNHIAYGIQWWEDNYIKGNQVAWNPPPAKNNKQEVLRYLTKAYDALQETMSSQKLTPEAIKGFHATIDHTTHHRGQAILYLRCTGTTPPEYTY
jgi:uncharacterized damage-inducible protein DinB